MNIKKLERIEIDGLLLRTREFRRRVMFCDKCLKYNHTSKLCNNKQVCKICLKSHDGTCVKDDSVVICGHCKKDHETGSARCPRRLLIQKKDAKKEKLLQIRTYAEMLRDAGNQMPGEDPTRYLEQPFDTNTRKRKIPRTSTPSSSRSLYTKKSKTGNENKDASPPPGFKKASTQPNDEIHQFLLSLINELNLQPFVTQMIIRFVVPIVHQFISNITNTVMDRMSNNTQ